MNNPALKALDYVPAVVNKVDRFGSTPVQWGRLFKIGKLRLLLTNMDSTEDVIQEVSKLILEYFAPGPRQQKRIEKLFEAGDGEPSPMLSVKAINVALANKVFDFYSETPIDPSRLPAPTPPPGPEPAWSTAFGDEIWDLVPDVLESAEARALLKYWDLNDPSDWEILAELLGVATDEAQRLVESATTKILNAKNPQTAKAA